MSRPKLPLGELLAHDILEAGLFSIPRWLNVFDQREFYAKKFSDATCYQVRCLFVHLRLVPTCREIDFGVSRGFIANRESRHTIWWNPPSMIPTETSAKVGDILDCKTPEELQALFETEYAIQAINP